VRLVTSVLGSQQTVGAAGTRRDQLSRCALGWPVAFLVLAIALAPSGLPYRH
jgi:hypothetical protein